MFMWFYSSCSAGVGRTGVFIALDHLTQHINDHDFVDIYGLVAELRSERMCMVQNLVRYLTPCAVSALDFPQGKILVATVWLGMDFKLYLQSRHSVFLHYKPPRGDRAGEGHSMWHSHPSAPALTAHPSLFITDRHIESNSKIDVFIFANFESLGSESNQFLL